MDILFFFHRRKKDPITIKRFLSAVSVEEPTKNGNRRTEENTSHRKETNAHSTPQPCAQPCRKPMRLTTIFLLERRWHRLPHHFAEPFSYSCCCRRCLTPSTLSLIVVGSFLPQTEATRTGPSPTTWCACKKHWRSKIGEWYSVDGRRKGHESLCALEVECERRRNENDDVEDIVRMCIFVGWLIMLR